MPKISKRVVVAIVMAVALTSVVTSFGSRETGAVDNHQAESPKPEEASAVPSPTEAYVVWVPAERLAEFSSVVRSFRVLANYGSAILANAVIPVSALVDTTAFSIIQDYDFIYVGGKALSLSEAESVLNRAMKDCGTPDPYAWVVRFVGPVKEEWLSELRQLGVEYQGYLPLFSHLVRFAQERRESIAALPFVQALLPFASPFKLPALQAFPKVTTEWDLLYFPDANIYSAPGGLLAGTPGLKEDSAKGFRIVRVQASRQQLSVLACNPNLFAVVPVSRYALADEVASEIVGGSDPALGSRVNTLGHNGYRILGSVIDTGLDDGSTSTMHPDLSSRVASFVDYTEFTRTDGVGEDEVDGHGTAVAGVIAGNGASGALDANGFSYGFGVAPQGSILAQRIYSATNIFLRRQYDKYNIIIGDFTWAQILQHAELRGVTVNSNSWGVPGSSVYGFDASEFDSIVRDADAALAGEQPMSIIFASGNEGLSAMTIRTPGTAKNVITVGASKNFRPDRPEHNGFSGWDAVNKDEMAPFSSTGPTEAGMLTDIRARASTRGPVTPPGAVTLTWSLTSSVDWALAAGGFRPAASNIAFDSSSSDQGLGSSYSWSHTTLGSDRLLVVGVALRNDGGQTVSSVTYGGSALTFLRSATITSSVRAELWYKVAPALGANNVVATLSASAKAVLGAVSLTGVHQTSPLDVNAASTGTSQTPSLGMVTVQDRAWIIDVVSFRASGINWPSATAGTGQVQRWMGHTEDGRIKPDLVAPGTWISSAQSSSTTGTGWGPITGDPQHHWEGGTSFSAPIVAGGAMLFQEFFRNRYGGIPSPALVKAALINGAVDMPATGTTYTTPVIPNHFEGWGRLNLENVLEAPVPVFYVDQTWALSQSEVATFAASASSLSSPLKITLAWSDAPATSLCNPCLVNNLDLEVTTPSGITYKGNAFDGGWSVTGKSHWDFSGDGFDDRNNLENVFIQSPGTGKYIIKVKATLINSDVRADLPGVNQDFALVVWNGDAQLAITSFSINGGSSATNNPSTQLATAVQYSENAYQMRFRNEGAQSWTQSIYSLDSDHGDGWGDLTYALEPWDLADSYDAASNPTFYQVVESQHPYPSQAQTTNYVVTGNVDTVRMRVGFRRIELAGSDSVSVRDCFGNTYAWGGAQKNVWTPDMLSCNSITIIFKTLNSGTAWGFYSETYIYATTAGSSYPANYYSCWVVDFNEKRRNDNHRFRIHLEYLDTGLDDWGDNLWVYDSVGFRGLLSGSPRRTNLWLPDALNIGLANFLGDVKLCFASDGDTLTGEGFRVDHYDHFVGYARGVERRWAIKQAGVSQIQVHFASRDVSSGDILEVRDAAGATYAIGTDGWSAAVPGDTLFARLSADFDFQTGSAGAAPAGFVVDAIKVYDYVWSAWEAFSTTKNGWSLSVGDGTKTVWAQVKDRSGKVAGGSDQIALDTQYPGQTTLLSPSCGSTTQDGSPAFTWSAFSDPSPSSGLKWFHFEVSTTSNFQTLVHHAHPTVSSYEVSLSDGTYYWRVKAEDNAQNQALLWSTPTTCTIIVSTVNNGILKGTVYDASAPPLQVGGATVKVYRNGVLIATTTTNVNGFYQITNLPTQTLLHIEVTKACYTWNPQDREIPTGGTVTLDFYATAQCQ